jgi:hypothetical protein
MFACGRPRLPPRLCSGIRGYPATHEPCPGVAAPAFRSLDRRDDRALRDARVAPRARARWRIRWRWGARPVVRRSVARPGWIGRRRSRGLGFGSGFFGRCSSVHDGVAAGGAGGGAFGSGWAACRGAVAALGSSSGFFGRQRVRVGGWRGRWRLRWRLGWRVRWRLGWRVVSASVGLPGAFALAGAESVAPADAGRYRRQGRDFGHQAGSRAGRSGRDAGGRIRRFGRRQPAPVERAIAVAGAASPRLPGSRDHGAVRSPALGGLPRGSVQAAWGSA